MIKYGEECRAPSETHHPAMIMTTTITQLASSLSFKETNSNQCKQSGEKTGVRNY